VKSTKVVEHLVALRETVKRAGIPVLYCPQYYSDQEFASWMHLNPIEKMMFDRKTFRRPGWGSEFHPDLVPDENTFVLSPHKVHSGFWAGDMAIQLRQRNIDTIILAGM
jgi:nicotinamidase-related amidase